MSRNTARADQLIVVGSAVVLALFPWNLALAWIGDAPVSALEIDCDMRVLSEARAQQYGKLLLFIAQRQSTRRSHRCSPRHLTSRTEDHSPCANHSHARRTARVVVARWA
jgi:hypothetical protein